MSFLIPDPDPPIIIFNSTSSNSSSSTGVGTSVVSNTTILSLGPGTLNGNCHWPYANPPTCDMTFATYYGSSYTLFSILFAISAAVILCATYIHHARLGRALQQHWPAGLQGHILRGLLVTSSILSFRAIDCLGFRAWIPIIMENVLSDMTTTLLITLCTAVVFNWIRIMRTLKISTVEATPDEAITAQEARQKESDRLNLIEKLLYIMTWFVVMISSILQNRVGPSWVLRLTKMSQMCFIIFVIMLFGWYYSISIYRFVTRIQSGLGSAQQQQELQKKNSSQGKHPSTSGNQAGAAVADAGTFPTNGTIDRPVPVSNVHISPGQAARYADTTIARADADQDPAFAYLDPEKEFRLRVERERLRAIRRCIRLVVIGTPIGLASMATMLITMIDAGRTRYDERTRPEDIPTLSYGAMFLIIQVIVAYWILYFFRFKSSDWDIDTASVDQHDHVDMHHGAPAHLDVVSLNNNPSLDEQAYEAERIRHLQNVEILQSDKNQNDILMDMEEQMRWRHAREMMEGKGGIQGQGQGKTPKINYMAAFYAPQTEMVHVQPMTMASMPIPLPLQPMQSIDLHQERKLAGLSHTSSVEPLSGVTNLHTLTHRHTPTQTNMHMDIDDADRRETIETHAYSPTEMEIEEEKQNDDIDNQAQTAAAAAAARSRTTTVPSRSRIMTVTRTQTEARIQIVSPASAAVVDRDRRGSVPSVSRQALHQVLAASQLLMQSFTHHSKAAKSRRSSGGFLPDNVPTTTAASASGEASASTPAANSTSRPCPESEPSPSPPSPGGHSGDTPLMASPILSTHPVTPPAPAPAPVPAHLAQSCSSGSSSSSSSSSRRPSRGLAPHIARASLIRSVTPHTRGDPHDERPRLMTEEEMLGAFPTTSSQETDTPNTTTTSTRAS